MRKLQILVAAVDVEVRPEQHRAHRRALDVPARPAAAERRLPGWFPFLRALPEDEIERVLLAGIDLDSFPRAQLVQRFARELAVARESAHRVVDVATDRAVRETAMLERVDHPDHLRDVAGGARLLIGLLDAELGCILVHEPDEEVGERLERFAVPRLATNDPVA